MTFDSPDSLHASASRMAAAMACVGSGAGTMPSARANCSAAGEALPLRDGNGLDETLVVEVRDERRHAVVAQPAGMDRLGDEAVARACAS